tara:strand:+ start:891 stop:1148 length:258 start_codon:yes stop_codon:yes gene_type:complete
MGPWVRFRAWQPRCRPVANGAHIVLSNIPKLFINVEPGQIVFERDLEILRSWSHSTEVVVRGLHHLQEDSPDDIGKALAAWYDAL